jgi:hypothetical protein
MPYRHSPPTPLPPHTYIPTAHTNTNLIVVFEKEIQIGRQAGRQACRQACRQAGMQAGRWQAGRQAYKQTEIWTGKRLTVRKKGKQRDIRKGRYAGRQADRKEGWQADRQAGIHTPMQIDRQTHRQPSRLGRAYGMCLCPH